MNTLTLLLALSGASCCVYVGAVCLCRLDQQTPRTQTRHSWALFYLAVLTISAWLAHDLLIESLDARDLLIAHTLAAYMSMTRRAWALRWPSLVERNRA